MGKNNIRLLTKEELASFVDKYEFKVEGFFVWTTVKNFNRPTVHSINDSFSISCNDRKLTITPKAIELWMECFQDKHLVEVQQAINTLILMYQSPQREDIDKILQGKI